MNISSYYIVRADRLPELQTEVNEMLAKGWQPVGGIAIVPRYLNDENLYDDVCWVQAMGWPTSSDS